jgi:glycosyltransferase involved in cell wall biosynthesis
VAEVGGLLMTTQWTGLINEPGIQIERPPLWTIGIATLASRREKLARLLAVLLPQCEADGRVEVLGFWDNGERSLAVKRQATLEQARGLYVSFFDDDDLPDPEYVPLITAAMTGLAEGTAASRPDYIAFEHAYYVSGVRQPVRIITGLEFGEWADDPAAGMLYRGVTQVNPVIAAAAKRADFRARSLGAEDWSYVCQVAPLLKTQARVEKVLYHYFHDPADSNQYQLAPHAPYPRLEVASPCFRWIDEESP